MSPGTIGLSLLGFAAVWFVSWIILSLMIGGWHSAREYTVVGPGGDRLGTAIECPEVLGRLPKGTKLCTEFAQPPLFHFQQ